MNLQEQINRIQSMMGVIKEDLYSPSGSEMEPNKFVVHQSNPMFRDKIKLNGLKPSVGECYQLHVNDFLDDNKDLYSGCQPAIFATNSLENKDMFNDIISPTPRCLLTSSTSPFAIETM